jgi:hypothetical protein
MNIPIIFHKIISLLISKIEKILSLNCPVLIHFLSALGQNAIVLAPLGDNIKFTSVTYDLYKTLQEALMPYWDPKTVFSNKG